MRVLVACVAVAVVASLPCAADEDGFVYWDKGYPRAGAKAGQIIVKGMAKAESGFTLVSASAKVWPKGGGAAETFKVQLNANGTFGPTTIPGLDSGGEYNVVVDVAESRNGQEQMRRTEPVVIRAP